MNIHAGLIAAFCAFGALGLISLTAAEAAPAGGYGRKAQALLMAAALALIGAGLSS